MALGLLLLLVLPAALGHDLSESNARFVADLQGPAPAPFLYLGAKHMFTGLDHVLFLLGVVFFLHRLRDVVLLISLFTLGHSLTLMLGVWFDWQVNAYLVDAVIGLSVVWKAFENVGGFTALGLPVPDARLAVFAFGLCHGLGLATKIQEYLQPGAGLVTNLVSFNVGVELGQMGALALLFLCLVVWRRSANYGGQAMAANLSIMCAGFVLAGIQMAGYTFA